MKKGVEGDAPVEKASLHGIKALYPVLVEFLKICGMSIKLKMILEVTARTVHNRSCSVS